MPAGTSALMSSMAHPGSMALPMDSAALLATPCPDMVGASRLSSSSYSFSDHITSCAVTFRLAPAEPRKPPDSSARRAQARRRLREEAKAQWKATQAWEKGQETKWGDAQGEQEKGWGQQEAREKRQEKRLQQQRSTTACDESSDLMKMFEDAKSAGAVVQVGPRDSGPPEPVDVEEVAMPQAVQVGDASESAWNEERERKARARLFNHDLPPTLTKLAASSVHLRPVPVGGSAPRVSSRRDASVTGAAQEDPKRASVHQDIAGGYVSLHQYLDLVQSKALVPQVISTRESIKAFQNVALYHPESGQPERTLNVNQFMEVIQNLFTDKALRAHRRALQLQEKTETSTSAPLSTLTSSVQSTCPSANKTLLHRPFGAKSSTPVSPASSAISSASTVNARHSQSERGLGLKQSAQSDMERSWSVGLSPLRLRTQRRELMMSYGKETYAEDKRYVPGLASD